MRDGLAQGWAPRRGRGARVVACCAIGWLLSTIAGWAADVSVESLQIGIVESVSQIDRTALGLDKALVGDKVRVSALVKNDAAASTGEFEVDFFFTEVNSGEHGRLGTQTVSGLEPGESKRPVLVFDTSSFSPGIYAFSAEADPRGELADTDPCDNAAPRAACAGAVAESMSKYAITLLREGRHISQLTLGSPLPLCRLGRLDSSLTVEVYNVGTETLTGSDLAVYGYYRLGLNPPANEFAPLVTDTAGNPAQLSKIVSLGEPGRKGTIVITLNYDQLSREFAPSSAARAAGEVLGRSKAAQIRITVQPADGGGTPQDLFLPAQFELSQFYSAVDLWTLPQRSSCCTGGCSSTVSAALLPAVAGGFVFHVTRSSDGDTLHVLKVRTGEEKGTWAAPAGKTLTSPVALFDEKTEAHRVFVGASDGRVYALVGTEKEEGDLLTGLWESPANEQIVKGDTFLVLSDDKSKVLVGSQAGAFVLDATTGQIARRSTNHGAATSAPLFVDATGDLWMAASEGVYRIPASGNECSYDVGEEITTDLVKNKTGSAIFFGTETGFVYAVGVGCTKLDEDRPLRSVVGIAVVSDSADAVVYLTSDIGEMARAEYDDGRGFRDVTASQRAVEPDVVAEAPAVLVNAAGDDALAVFVAGLKREGRANRPILQACDRDLEELETVTAWGTAVPFIFKPEEGGKAPSALLRPVIDQETFTLLIASSDGYLYAFDLAQFE